MSPPKRQRRRPYYEEFEDWFAPGIDDDWYFRGNPWYEAAKAVRAASRWGTRSRTGTVTQTMSPTNMLGPAIVGGEMSYSEWTDARQTDPMARRMIDEMVAHIEVYDNQDQAVTSSPGTQQQAYLDSTSPGVDNYRGNFSYTDIDKIWTQMRLAYGEELAAAANSDQVYAESGAIYLRECETVTDFCNQSNQMCWFTLYELVKSQTDRLEPAAPSSDAEVFDPITLWQQGLNQQATTGMSAMNQDHVGAVPFVSHRFCQEWHVKKVTRVCLGPGDLHRHRTFWAPNSIISYSDVARATGEDTYVEVATYLKGITHRTMVVLHGQVCCANVSGRATYSGSKLCWVTTRRTKSSYGLGYQKPVTSDLSNITTIGTNIMNQDTANAEPYETAG